MNEYIVYKDISYNFLKNIESITADGEINDEYMNLEFLKKSLFAPRLTATLESNRWKLDGACDLEGSSEDSTVGLYSRCVSNNQSSEFGYELDSPISLTYQFKEVMKLQHITFTFGLEEYCSYFYIELYQNGQTVHGEYVAVDSPFYNLMFAESYTITGFKIEFIAMNKPNRHLRLYNIDEGESWELNEDDIFEVKILGEMSLLADALPHGTIDINYNNKNTNFPIPSKFKPVYIFQKSQCERVGFVDSVDTLNPKNNVMKLVDAPALIDFEKIITLDTFVPQNLYENAPDTDFEYYLATSEFKYDGTTKKPNYTQYNSQINYVTLLQIFNKLLKDYAVNVNYKINDEKSSHSYYESYVYGDTLQKILIKVLFANQLSFKVNSNGVCTIVDNIDEVYSYDESTMYSDYKAELNDAVNSISLAVYTPEVENVSIEHDNKVYSITAETGTMLAFKFAHFEPMYRITKTVDFTQNAPNELYVALRDSISDKTNYMRVEYDKIYMKSTTFKFDVIQNSEYVSPKTVSVEDNAFVEPINIDSIVNNLSRVYENNKKISFRSSLRGEREGDWAVIIMGGKKFTGRIKQIQYTLTNKKIADILFQVYLEEDVK